ncbi:MAG: insulinase family protein, partial [Muribaculaceae bacterium]|nr:insulinase family protein [Muribaculaceae bacterium]
MDRSKMNGNETIVTTLSNGLKVVCRQVETQAEYCGVFINAGSRDEIKPRQFGTAHFIDHTIFKSTLYQ